MQTMVNIFGLAGFVLSVVALLWLSIVWQVQQAQTAQLKKFGQLAKVAGLVLVGSLVMGFLKKKPPENSP